MMLFFYVPLWIAEIALIVFMVKDGLRIRRELQERKRERDSRPRYYR